MTEVEFMNLWHDGSEYIECNTSGSTGKPKTIRLAKSDMVRSANATNTFFNLGKNSIYVCPISLNYIGGKMMAVRASVSGGQLVIIPPSNNFKFDGVADLLAIVPPQIPAILNAPNGRERFRHIIVGGAPISPDSRKSLVDGHFNVWQTYGMTETTSHVALAKVTDNEPVFEALPGVKFYVDSRDCLIIDRPGYINNHLVTNDVVRLIDETTFVWLGRADNVINSGGIKIHPEQLEADIVRIIPHLADRIMIRGVADDKWGESPELVVEGETDFESLAEMLEANLDHRLLPRKITAVDAFERTANGKVKRKINLAGR